MSRILGVSTLAMSEKESDFFKSELEKSGCKFFFTINLIFFFFIELLQSFERGKISEKINELKGGSKKNQSKIENQNNNTTNSDSVSKKGLSKNIEEVFVIKNDEVFKGVYSLFSYREFYYLLLLLLF
jgi:hypothetical protein